MKVKVRFFARFRELLGTDIVAERASGTGLAALDHGDRREEERGLRCHLR